MPLQQQNAIVAACTLVMLLLLGLYILELNNVFARSSTAPASTSLLLSSSSSPLAPPLSQSQSELSQSTYRHPVSSAAASFSPFPPPPASSPRSADYPLEHYHQQQQQQQQQPQQPQLQQHQPAGLMQHPAYFRPHQLAAPDFNGRSQAGELRLPAPPFLGQMQMQPPPPPPLRPPPPPPPQQQQHQQSNKQPQLEPTAAKPNSNRLPLAPLQSASSSSSPTPQSSQIVNATASLLPPPPVLAAGTPTSLQQQQAPPSYVLDDADYPTADIMRAVESFAVDRPLDSLLAQSLVQLSLASALMDSAAGGRGGATPNSAGHSNAQSYRQLLLDSLQPSMSSLAQLALPAAAAAATPTSSGNQRPNSPAKQQAPAAAATFPSTSYESLCRSTAFMAQPRRAKSIGNQWKIIVNLPGHKYRGVAISQMVRVEECVAPNGECTFWHQPASSSSSGASNSNSNSNLTNAHLSYLPKSRCLQHYQNQPLIAWSAQLGFHSDIFRFPSACSCHMKRSV